MRPRHEWRGGTSPCRMVPRAPLMSPKRASSGRAAAFSGRVERAGVFLLDNRYTSSGLAGRSCVHLAHAQEVSDSLRSPCLKGARGAATQRVVGFHGYLHANYQSRPDSTSHRAIPRGLRVAKGPDRSALLVAEGAETAAPILRENQLEHVVDGDHSDHVLVLVHHR